MNYPSLKTKLIAGSVAAGVVLGGAGVAFARTPLIDTRADIKAEVRADIEVGKQERKDNASTTKAEMQAKREAAKIEIKAKLDAKKQENVANVIRNRVRAFQKIVKQQSERVTRLSSVAATLKANGKNTAAAEGFLIDARVKLSHASSTLATINANASTTAAATTPGEKLNQLKKTFDSVQSDLKVVHEDIADAITSLKGLGNVNLKVEAKATSTTN
jgi:hypothetical protein